MLVDEDVGRLQIAMDDAAVVRVLNRLADRRDERHPRHRGAGLRRDPSQRVDDAPVAVGGALGEAIAELLLGQARPGRCPSPASPS